jgi:hypothetical protein
MAANLPGHLAGEDAVNYAPDQRFGQMLVAVEGAQFSPRSHRRATVKPFAQSG